MFSKSWKTQLTVHSWKKNSDQDVTLQFIDVSDKSQFVPLGDCSESPSQFGWIVFVLLVFIANSTFLILAILTASSIFLRFHGNYVQLACSCNTTETPPCSKQSIRRWYHKCNLLQYCSKPRQGKQILFRFFSINIFKQVCGYLCRTSRKGLFSSLAVLINRKKESSQRFQVRGGQRFMRWVPFRSYNSTNSHGTFTRNTARFACTFSISTFILDEALKNIFSSNDKSWSHTQ